MFAKFARTCAVYSISFAIWLFAGLFAYAGPGHDHSHGSEPSTQHQGPVHPRVVATSDLYDLVGILVDHKLTLYLDRRVDTAPVSDAKIDLTIGDESVTAQPQPDGTYLIDHDVLNQHKAFDVIADIRHTGGNDLLVGTLDATVAPDHDQQFDHDHSIHHPDGAAHGHDVNGVGFHIFDSMGTRLMLTVTFFAGSVLGFLVAYLIWARRHVAVSILVLMTGLSALPDVSLAGPGHDHGHATHEHNGPKQDSPGRLSNGVIFIPKPTQRLLEIRTKILRQETARRSERLIGRVIADPNRNGLVQSTIRGRIISPEKGLPVLGQAVKAGDVLAFVEPAFAPIDASDVRQTAGDLEQRMAVLRARLSRQRQLVSKNVASKASLQDLEIELEGLQLRRKQLDESRSKPETLTSPVTGVVADVRAVVGQVVESSDTLFHIVDPQRLWVEALAFDTKLSREQSATAFTADHTPLKLSFVGRSRALQQQAIVMHYQIQSPPRALSIGAPLSVIVETGSPITGLILPKDSVAEAPNGQSVAYVRQAPEEFRAVPVRTENLDGQRVRVVAGLKAGDQVIVRGASLVSQIR